jgi:hypothetical protein
MPKTNDVKVYVNILPLVIIFLLIGGAGYFLFGQDIKIPSKEDSLTKITRVEGFPYRVSVSDERTKERVVITSEEELTNLMAKIDPEGQIELRENFNFKKNILIVASTETLTGNLNKYKIKQIIKDSKDKSLVVEQELTVPIEECPEKTTPEEAEKKSILVDLIQLNKTGWPIDFELVKRELPCGEF